MCIILIYTGLSHYMVEKTKVRYSITDSEDSTSQYDQSKRQLDT